MSDVSARADARVERGRTDPLDAGPLDTVHAAWSAGRAARNGWLTVPDAHLVEVVAAYAAGHDVLDALTLDLQHGLFDRASTAAAVRAVDAHGLAPLVRLPAVDDATVGFVLDLGVRGVIAPMVSDVATATELVAACRYPPAGRRSFGPVRTALRPGRRPRRLRRLRPRVRDDRDGRRPGPGRRDRRGAGPGRAVRRPRRPRRRPRARPRPEPRGARDPRRVPPRPRRLRRGGHARGRARHPRASTPPPAPPTGSRWSPRGPTCPRCSRASTPRARGSGDSGPFPSASRGTLSACSRPPPACCACSRCCRPARSGRARSSPSGSASPPAPCAGTSTSSAGSTTRSRSASGPSGGYRLGAGAALPAAAARRRRGRRGRGDAADRGRVRGGGHGGDGAGRAGQARADPARAPAAPGLGDAGGDRGAAASRRPSTRRCSPSWAGRAATGASSRSTTPPATGPRPVGASSRSTSSPGAGAGTSWPGTATARTGAPCASTASRPRLAPDGLPTGPRFAPREIPGGDPAAFVSDRVADVRPFRCVVRVEASAEQVRATIWTDQVRIEPDRAGRVPGVAVHRRRPRRELILLGLDVEFVVESPDGPVRRAAGGGGSATCGPPGTLSRPRRRPGSRSP